MVLSHCTVLIVEDSSAGRELYQRYLLTDSSCHYHLLEAESVAQGLELCRINVIDAVLLGYSLSSEDRLAFLELLYGQGQVGRPSVIMVAAEGDVSIAVCAIKLGAEDYLVEQNLTPEGLQLAMQSAVEKARLRLQLQEGGERFRESSESQVRRVLNSLFSFVGVMTPDGTLIEANRTALEAASLSPEDVLGRPFPDAYWWAYDSEIQDQLRAAIQQAATGESVCYDVQVRLGEDRFITIDFGLAPLFDEAGQVEFLIPSGIDITERKQAEAALLESEERFRTLADNISQLAWMADAKGWIFWYNHRWFDYTGTTLDQMQGWGWQQVHHPEHLERVVERFRACLESGERWEDTFPLRGQDGTYRWFLSRAIPITNEEGQILRWFGTNTDITDLQSAQAALEKRNKELDSFVYIVSHDLKTPLRAIANLSQWIEEDLAGSLSADTQEQMTLLRSRVYRMAAMIDGLLNYARVGRTDSTIELVAIGKLLLEVIDSAAPPPTFTITIAPNLPTLYTKRLLLSQVFANLIGNGIKHHDRIDGSVHVSAEDRGDFYEFAVADDGPGIALEYQDNIFTIFQTGNPQKRQDSTGIGLAIVKKIVETEAGAIRLESQIGKGTTFYFTWPKQSRIDVRR